MGNTSCNGKKKKATSLGSIDGFNVEKIELDETKEISDIDIVYENGNESSKILTIMTIDPPQKRRELLINEAHKLFHEGNILFRESKCDQAMQHYLNGIDKLKDCEATSQINKLQYEMFGLSNLGVMEFAEGRYEEAKLLLTKALLKRSQFQVDREYIKFSNSLMLSHA